MSDKTESKSKLTTVKTVYARAVMLLLAVNFCLTTYVVVNLNKSVQMQVDQAIGMPVGGLETPETKASEDTTSPSTTQEVSTDSPE